MTGAYVHPSFMTGAYSLKLKCGSGQVRYRPVSLMTRCPNVKKETSMESNSKTAWTVSASVFLVIFKALCASFDPTMAFALSLVVLLAVKN